MMQVEAQSTCGTKANGQGGFSGPIASNGAKSSEDLRKAEVVTGLDDTVGSSVTEDEGGSGGKAVR